MVGKLTCLGIANRASRLLGAGCFAVAVSKRLDSLLCYKNLCAYGALFALSQSRFGAGRRLTFNGLLGVSQCLDSLLCYKDLCAYGALFALGKSRLGAGRRLAFNGLLGVSQCLDGFGLNVTAYKAGQGFCALLRAGGSGIDSALAPGMLAFCIETARIAFAVAVFVLVVKERQRTLSSKHLAAKRANGSAGMSMLRAGGRNVILLYGVMLKLGRILLVGVIASLAGMRDHALALTACLSERFGLIIVTGCRLEQNSATDASVVDLALYAIKHR